MASVYTNDLRLEEIGSGEQSGSWGDTTNTNLELIAEAFAFGTEAITTNANTHTTTIADGASDPGRAMFLKYTGTLDSACTITIGPNTVSKMWFIENGTSGSQNIIIKQGSGATITIPPGDTKAIYSNGAGGGGAMFDAFASLSVVDLKVQDDLTVTDDLVVGGLATIGETLVVTGVLTTTAATVSNGGGQFNGTVTVGVDDTGYDVKFFGDTASAFMLWDASADDLILGGAAGLSVNSAALVTGVLTTTAATVSNGGGQFNGAINVGVDDTGYDVKFFGATASAYMQWDASTDDLILGGVSRLGIGTTAPLSALHVQGADAASSVITVANGATTVSNGDSLGLYNFFGRDSSSNSVGGMGNISVTAVGDQNDGSTPTKMVFSTHPNSANDASLLGNVVARLTIDHEGALNQTSIAGGHTVFNTGGIDSNYTFKSNGNDSMLFIDGGNNRVGIGTSVPGTNLQVNGDGLQVRLDGTANTSRGIMLRNTGSAEGQIQTDGNMHFIQEDAGKYMRFSTANTERMRIDATGAVTMPLQPAFLVHPASAQNNIALNSPVAIVLATEIFDQNGDFSSNGFTAPVTGKYQFNVNVRLDSVDSAANFYELQLSTSNRTYQAIIDPGQFNGDLDYFSLSISALADMDASDTAAIKILQSAGTAQTDIDGGAANTNWSGYLVA